MDTNTPEIRFCDEHGRLRGIVERVRYLYIPPGKMNFRCRTCWDLVYETCQKSSKPSRLELTVARACGIHPCDMRRVRDRAFREIRRERRRRRGYGQTR